MRASITPTLPQTDKSATITFSSSAQAKEFTRMYTRKTLMGHSVKANRVIVWNVTPEIESWINTYLASLTPDFTINGVK